MAWGTTDLSVFAHASLADRAWDRARRTTTMARDVAHLATTIVGWHAADAARRLTTHAKNSYRAGRNRLRLPRGRSSGDTVVVIVNLTLGRDPILDDLRLRLAGTTEVRAQEPPPLVCA